MTKDFEDLFGDWLQAGPTRASDRFVAALRADVARTPQRSRSAFKWRVDSGMSFLKLAAVAAVVVVIFVGALGLAPSGQPSVGASPGGLRPRPSTILSEGVNGPWSALPRPVDVATIDDIEASCQRAFAIAKDLPVRHPEHVIGVPIALVDARGLNVAHGLFSDGDGESGGLCWNGEVTADNVIRRATDAELLLSWPPDLPTLLDAEGVCVAAMARHEWRGRQVGYSFAGRASPRVRSVVIRVDGIGDVTPTFEAGWFVAWWPGPSDQYTVIAIDANGESIAELSKRRIDEGFSCAGE
jgi:hypothetical protein